MCHIHNYYMANFLYIFIYLIIIINKLNFIYLIIFYINFKNHGDT